MKKIFTPSFDWSLVAIAFFSLMVSFFVFVNILHAKTGGGGLDKVKIYINGWAWSPNIGWLSLNCNNDFDGDGDIESNCITPYGLEIDESNDGTVRATGGCAWAGNVGWWICFDDPDIDDGVGHADAPDWGVYLNGPSGVQYYNVSEPDFTGWPDNNAVENSLCHNGDTACHASILALEEVSSWSNELGFPIDDSDVFGTLEGCFNCRETKTCSNSPYNICTQDTDCGEGNTCNTARTCDNCLQYAYNPDDSLQSVKAGYQCSNCTFDGPQQEDTICTENAYERNKNSCTACDKYYNIPGLMVDYTTVTNDGYGSMCGWAWNQATGGNGVGWIQFGPRITAGNNPYFQVNSGDIYAKGQIKNKNILGPNIYNAFVIETGSNMINNLYASSTLNLINRPLVSFPTLSSTGKYTNTLGSIDYTGLSTQFGANMNKYGSMIYNNTNGVEWGRLKNGGTTILLNNSVYDATSDLTLAQGSEIVFTDGTGTENGAGIITIKGNVTIDNNIKYDASTPDKLKNIASPVFIIDGNLTINSGVGQLAGTFIVFGIFDTGTSNTPLVVNGSVLAQRFVLGRTYSSGPAELFINDGRLKVNPPAGLQNFSANLPQFSYQ